MGMVANDIQRLLKKAFPKGTIELVDLAGDNEHFSVTITAPDFQGKSRIQQHKMVYDAFQGKMGYQLHALSVKTLVPEE